MSLDVARLRAGFPSLASGIAHFDGPGGTQTPSVVGQAIADTLTGPLSNRGTSVASEQRAEDAVAAFRSAAADLLGADPRGIVFGRSATQLSYDFSKHLSRDWGPGNEVVVTRLDHDSNVRPWVQAAERTGATVRWIEIDPATAELDLSTLDDVVTERTRLVAVTAASNLLGTVPPVRTVADRAHAVGALVYVDGVHYTAHRTVDVAALGADFFACSPYKFLGPHCGILAASPELLESIRPDKLLPSTNVVPERFEFGTLPYEIMAGATAAINALAAIDPGSATTRREQLIASAASVHDREITLRSRIEQALAELGPLVELHSRASDRTATLFMTFSGRSSVDAAAFLAQRDVLAPAGSFYAIEPFIALALADDAGLRVGVAPYTSDDDVDRLLDGLREFLAS
ncbi:MAG TPA: cysteine desulfurase-like protein [Plantibacter sp.]|uniref:cysteine desulfurase-like protein n=1 Tax=Plantibacter sp. TaxID=1871045 RepID=UPI002CC1FEE3|nr:cysteine desulfurase-like protein [Plantibacter sp.]